MAKGKYNEWLTDEGLTLIRGWKRNGLKDAEIADNIGISLSTFYEWKKKYSEFSDNLKKGKEVADFMVEDALFKLCIGFTIREQRFDKNGNVVWLIKEIPPNITAIIFYLKNRNAKHWNNDIKVDTETDNKLNINIKGIE